MGARSPGKAGRVPRTASAALLALAALLLLPGGSRPTLVGTATVSPAAERGPHGAATEPAAPRAPQAAGVTIAIVDTGVAPLPALTPALLPGYDLAGGGTGDGNGHGTAMASIAAGRGSGVCGSCSILPVRVTGNAGISTTALAAAGVRAAAAAHARVINVSLTSTANDPALAAAIADAVAGGSVVVVAAGNDGSTDPTAGGYPAAAAPDALTVAGVDSTGRLYPWSNHGPWVRLAAPGSLRALGLSGAAITAVGTSASAAYVSGTVGRMLAADPALSPAQVASILTSSGTPEPGLDVATGRVVDAGAAVAAAAALR